MKVQEFEAILKKANSLKALMKLREVTGAPLFVSKIKQKIGKILLKRGFEAVEISATSLLKYFRPVAGAHAKFKMENSRKLSAYNNKRVEVYVNNRFGTKFCKCDIYIKVK